MNKRRLATAIVALCSASLIIAQPPCRKEKANFSPEEKSAKQTEWMKKELNLTDDQAKKIEEINLKYDKKTLDLKAQIKENRKQQRTEVKSVLTEEQRKTFKEKKAEMKKRKGDKAHKQGKKDHSKKN